MADAGYWTGLDKREAFEKCYPALDFTRSGFHYKAPATETLWQGWRDGWRVREFAAAPPAPAQEAVTRATKSKKIVGVPRKLVEKIRDIKTDLADFDGDRRGHFGALQNAEEALIRAALAALEPRP